MSLLLCFTHRECLEIAKLFNSVINPTITVYETAIYINDDEINRHIEIHAFNEHTTSKQILNESFKNKKRYLAFNDPNNNHDFICYINYFTNRNTPKYLDIPEKNIKYITNLFLEKEVIYDNLNFKAKNYDFKNLHTCYLDFFTEGEIERINIKDVLHFKHPRFGVIMKKLNEANLDQSWIKDKIIKELNTKRHVIQNNFQLTKSKAILNYYRDIDGVIDLIAEDVFMKMLNENQTEILKVNRDYIHKFVKIANYLKLKRSNIQVLFNLVKESNEEIEFENKRNFFESQLYSYQLLLFHSISMLTALLEDNVIVFFEIYEAFDKLSIFNSYWENEVSRKLSSLDTNLSHLIDAVNRVEYSISVGLESLSYTTQNSFENLQSSIDEQLININSSVRVSNLMNVIQIYQLYKVNKHTKSIR